MSQSKREAFLDQWVKTEKTVYYMLAAGLLLFAAYLWANPPFPRLSGGLSGDILPLAAGAGSILMIWFSSQDQRIRRMLVNLKSGQAKTLAILLVISALFSFSSWLLSRNGYEPFVMLIFAAGAGLSWWRAGQVEKLRRL